MHSAHMRPPNPFRKLAISTLIFAFGLLEYSPAAADLVPVPALGLRVARGFRVTLFADDSLASDIYAMTLDASGNVVVSSQGYIRTLFDRNNDGVAEAAEEFAQTTTGGVVVVHTTAVWTPPPPCRIAAWIAARIRQDLRDTPW